MPEISLRAYVDYIQDRLERDAFSEVVAQCRHVLEIYPKYIEVYKLLARALLEQENYQDATDIFQRVLSADPNDFIAHIGISECYHESGAIDPAIWHLERAFEQVPSNVDLQEEIKRLYAERDGSAPRKVQLTAGALARLYMNGKLYPQAILELRKALSRDPDRPDLQLLLADALWHNHQQVEAGELAASVLKRLPNSIDANRILAQLWLHAGQPAEAEPFLDRLAELDPYLAYSIRHDGESAPADAFELPMLEYTAERHASEVGAAEWVSQIRAVEKSDRVTGTLKGASAAVTDVPSKDDAEKPDTGPVAGRESSIPDWLSGAYSSSLKADRPDREAGSEPPAAPEPASDLDRLLGARPAEPAAPASKSESGEPDWLAEVLGSPGEAKSSTGSGTPDWLEDILGTTPATPASPAPAEPSAEKPDKPEADAPDWLKEILGEDEEPAQSPAPEARAEAAKPETPEAKDSPPDEDEDEDETPDWLAEPLGEPAPAPDEERATPDWLSEILAGDEPAPPGKKAPETVPVVSTDWLDEIITGGAAKSGTPDEAAAAGFFAVDESDAPPDWLGKLEDEGDETGELVDFGELEPWDAIDGLPDDEPDDDLPELDLPDLPDADMPVSELLGEAADDAAEKGPLYTRRLGVAATASPSSAGGDAPAEADELPDWLASPALKTGDLKPDTDDTKQAAPSGDLQPAEDAAASGPAAVREEQQVTPPTEEPTGDESSQELPDWLVEGDLDNSDDAIAWLEELAAKYDPDFQSDAEDKPGESEGGDKAEGDLPDWLRDEKEEDKQPAAEAPKAAEDFPDWLTGAPAPAARAAEASAGDDDDDLPDWLRDDKPEAEAKPAARADEPLDWLMGETSRQTEAERPADEKGEDALPDWLREEPAAAAAATPAPAAPEPASKPEAEKAEEVELPDWLKNMRRSEAEEEDDLDWLYEATGAKDEEEEEKEEKEEKEEEEAAPAMAAPVAKSFPDWLASADEAEEKEEFPLPPRAKLPTAPGEDKTEEAFEWMDKQIEAQGVSPDEPLEEALTEDVPPTRAPLAESEDKEAEPVSEDEMPEWLKQAEAREEVALTARAAEDELLEAAGIEAADDDLAWLDSALEAEEILFTDEDFESVFGEADEEEVEAPALAAPPAPEPVEKAEEEEEEEEETPEPEPAIAPAAGMPDWLTAPEKKEEPEAKPAEEPEPATPVIEGDAYERLRLAREKLQGRFEEAVPYYESLVASGEMLEQTISDITYYLRSTNRPDPRARRILGDAYREQGQLDKALEAYRAALDEL